MTKPISSIAPRNYAWGVGGVADNLLTFGTAWTIFPIFNIGYGLDAFWLGIAIFVPRFIDVITDPIMGVISDRTRSRWGRRRPYIFSGAFIMAGLFALLWLPPFGAVEATEAVEASTAGGGGWSLPPLPVGDELVLLLWVGVTYSLLNIAYTVFSVPYIAMGFEFTRNTDAMTRMMASRLYFTTLAGLAVPWFYRLAVSDRFDNQEAIGMRYIGVAIALAIVLTGIVPALVCREDPKIERPRERVSIKDVVRATLGNRAFLLVMSAMLVFVIAMFSTGAFQTHVNIFYVAEGDKKLGTELSAISGVIIGLSTLIGMYPMTRLSRMFSKRRVALAALGTVLVGYASLWFTWSPEIPQLQYISAAVIGFGSSGIWLMFDSMIGDVTKDDEARNGVQREGLYGASKSFMFKVAVAITSISGAFALSVSGFEENVAPSDGVLLNLRVLFISILCTGIAVSMLAVFFFPITRKRAEENERIIDERKATAE